MLDRVTFPLTTAQISEFVLDKEYTNFLTLQTAISELMETGLAESRTILNRTQLQITDEGRDTLHYFENRISDAIKSDIIDYFKNHKLELRNESSIQGNFYKLVNGEFEAQLVAKDKDVDLVNIRISVPTQELAASICANHLRQLAEEKQGNLPIPDGTVILIIKNPSIHTQYCVYVRVFYYPLFGTSPPLYFSSSSGSAASFLMRFICSFIFTS